MTDRQVQLLRLRGFGQQFAVQHQGAFMLAETGARRRIGHAVRTVGGLLLQ